MSALLGMPLEWEVIALVSFRRRLNELITRVVIPGNPDPEFPGFGVFFPIPIPGLYV